MSSKQEMPRADEPTTEEAHDNVGVRIGVVGDTHGYLDPRILDVFAGMELIIHAGDVGDPKVLDALRTVAPVVAVAGNLDGDNAVELPTERVGDIAGLRFALGHKRKRLVKRVLAGDEGTFDLVVFGHDHVPSVSWVEGTLWVNPGSASAPYEEDERPTVAIVERFPTGLGVRFIPLARRKPQAPAPAVKTSGKRP